MQEIRNAQEIAMLNDKRKLYAAQRNKAFIKASPYKPQITNAKAAKAFIGRFLQAVRPYDAAEAHKVRLGSHGDGGYVMLDPGHGGIAYSLGISTYAPWDLEMAERGFKVHQYDASIADTPTPHPNIIFHPYFIMDGGALPDNARRLSQELIANGDWKTKDIILQIDEEGAEWDIFAAMGETALKKFRQIIVEFHYLNFNVEKLSILEKLLATHTPVHVHYNNNGKTFKYINNFIYQPYFLEISYARNGDYTFTPCNNYFPTPIDAPNVQDKPDVPIGFFDMLLEDFNAHADIAKNTSPPKEIPEALYNKFTMDGKINIQHWYFDERTFANNVHITQRDYEKAFKALDDKSFKYYGDEIKSFYDAMDDYSVSGKRVLVWGLAGCNCEAIALWKNAAEVYVVDYNKPTCDHERVHTVTHDELQKLAIRFDFAISFSSFEHDGLGRYGDPINPDGDLRAMQEAAKYLQDDGILFLGVPLGPDCLCWNAHRIYGTVRLPLLLRDWIPLDAYSPYPDVFGAALGEHRQPLLVLKKSVPGSQYAVRMIERFKSSLSGVGGTQGCGTKNEKILGHILEFMLIDGFGRSLQQHSEEGSGNG
ncbi:MAG: DUF268 domain-containing protein [Deltaproteobacteria bacterium]|jgi:hypothetical protein|nr:DUF268 domain-containing protein [Deltaproteobacteria bacterium]